MLAFVISLALAGAAAVGGFVADDAVFLLAVAVIFGVLALLWLQRVIFPRPTLVLSPAGVQLRDGLFIDWANLERLEVSRRAARFLAFHLHDDSRIGVKDPAWRRAWRRLNRAVEGAPASVTENMVTGRFEEVVPLILQYKDVPVSWRG